MASPPPTEIEPAYDRFDVTGRHAQMPQQSARLLRLRRMSFFQLNSQRVRRQKAAQQMLSQSLVKLPGHLLPHGT